MAFVIICVKAVIFNLFFVVAETLGYLVNARSCGLGLLELFLWLKHFLLHDWSASIYCEEKLPHIFNHVVEVN